LVTTSRPAAHGLAINRFPPRALLNADATPPRHRGDLVPRLSNGEAGELKIAGESASGIISELNEMRGKNPRANIMNLHALAYTPAEIGLIADYISRQGR
jgi:hypothetical protein